MGKRSEITELVDKLLKDTEIPPSQQAGVSEYIADELLRKIDFYSRKFYMITTKEGGFIRYDTDSSGSKGAFMRMAAASSATVFDDVITCDEVHKMCLSKYPSEVFTIKVFEY